MHPRGQAKMGELLAIAANGGVQILVETHSDHVLNGVRVAVHQRLVEAASVALSSIFNGIRNDRMEQPRSKNLSWTPAEESKTGHLAFLMRWTRALRYC